MKKWLLIITGVLLLLPVQLSILGLVPFRRAAALTFTAASCSSADLQTAITAATSAGNGNYVLVAGGQTCTLLTKVTNPPGTSFRMICGIGGGTTTFVRKLSPEPGPTGYYTGGTYGDEPFEFWADDTVYPLEIAHCTMDWEAGTYYGSPNFIMVHTTVAGGRVRIHHNIFNNTHQRAVYFRETAVQTGVFPTALSDYNEYNSLPATVVTDNGHMQGMSGEACQSGSALNGSGQFSAQDDLMGQPNTPGGETNIVYSENDSYNYHKPQDGGIEAYGCLQFVLRFDTLNGVNQGSHGNEGQRSMKWWEIYKNAFTTALFVSDVAASGGTPVGPYTITASNKNWRTNPFGLGVSTCVLTEGSRSAALIAGELNTCFTSSFGAYDDGGKVHIHAVGGSFTIAATSNSAYSTLGFTTGTKGQTFSGRIHHFRGGNGFTWGNTYSALITTAFNYDVYRVDGGRWPHRSAPAAGYCSATIAPAAVPGWPYDTIAHYMLWPIDSTWPGAQVSDGNTGVSGSTSYPFYGYPCWDQSGYTWNQYGNAMRTYTRTPVANWLNIQALSGADYASTAYSSTVGLVPPVPPIADMVYGVNRVPLTLSNGIDFMNRNTACDTPGGACTSGVGSALIANRPTSCTVGAYFWATNEGTWDRIHAGFDGRLYYCSATNTWTLFYTPLTFPHPKASYKVAFTDQPAPTIISGGSLGTVKVTTQYVDSETYEGNDTVFLTANGCVMGGTASAQSVSGVATFTDLTFTGGGICNITATVYGLETDISDDVEVTATPPELPRARGLIRLRR